MSDSVFIRCLGLSIEISRHARERAGERGLSRTALRRLALSGEAWLSNTALFVAGPLRIPGLSGWILVIVEGTLATCYRRKDADRHLRFEKRAVWCGSVASAAGGSHR